MAAPTIKIKRSAVSGNAPTTAQLELGELALNTYDGKLFTEINTGSASIVEIGGHLQHLAVSGITTLTGNVVVGGTVDGRDLATDGSKLDGIEALATADQTASEILTLLKTVDGAGSGLDADTLDGVSSASFLRSDANDTFTGVLTVNGRIGLTGNSFHGNVYSTGISTISGFRFPTTDGDEDQALVTDGNGSLSFKTLSGGGGATGAATTISAGVTTATQGQTAFTTVHPHNDGTTTRSVQVFINGLKQRPSGAGNATKDFTASSNSTITLENGTTVGDEVRTVVYYNHTIDEEYFTATEGQTLFTLTGTSAAQKFFRVYVNGAKLRNGTDYGVAAPVTLVAPCAEGDHVEIVCDDAEDAFTATDQQVNFTPTATTITEENMQVFINGVQQTPTVDYSIGDPAVTFADAVAANVGDQIDVCIRRS